MVQTGKRQVCGVLLLDKATGISSNRALQQVKHLYQAQKAGHTGSLDPLASGMLPICFGEATKFSQYLLDADKEYYVVAQLGIKTDSGDAEGKVITQRAVPVIPEAALNDILNAFKGDIIQIPPMYSALKHQGQPLYKLARKGIEIERKPRHVHIYNIELCHYSKQTLALKVKCSKGTYIRTLIEDIGERLTCGAHVTVLRRLSVAPYCESQMVTFATLSQLSDNDAIDSLLYPIDSLLANISSLALSPEQALKIRQGQVVSSDSPMEGLVKLYLQADFIGLGKLMNSKLAAERLIAY